MKHIYAVIANCGDGSNCLEWYKDTPKSVLERLADDGDDRYASGDGVQIIDFHFPQNFDLTQWALDNHIHFDEKWDD